MFNLFPDFQTLLVYAKKAAKIAWIKASGTGVTPGTISTIEGDHVRPNAAEDPTKSGAALIGEDGNFQILTEDEPAWDFLNDCPKLTMMPQRTNRFTVNDFTSYTASRLTKTEGATTLLGLTAATILETTDNNSHILSRSVVFAAGDNCYILLVKAIGRRYLAIRFSGGEFLGTSDTIFDLLNGVVDTQGANLTGSVTPFGNDVYAVVLKGNAANAGTNTLSIKILNDAKLESYVGEIDKGFAISSPQIVSGSFFAGLIPVSGSALTRAASSFTLPGLQAAGVFAEGFSIYIDLLKYLVDGNEGTIMSFQKADGTPVIEIKALDTGITIYDPVAGTFADSEMKTLKGIIIFDGQRVKLIFNGAKQIDYLCPAPAVIDKLFVAAAGNYFSFNHLLFSNIALPEAVAIQHVPAL